MGVRRLFPGSTWGSSLALRLSLGLPLVVSGLAKLIDLAHFREILQHQWLLSSNLADLVAVTLPWLELLLGLCLVIGIWLDSSSFLAGFLCLALSAAAGIALTGAGSVECGCLGTLSQARVSWLHLLVNLVGMGISYRLHRHACQQSLEPPF